MRIKSGFTLAEVLITLGIIGIVAAMTIPSLIAGTQMAQFRSKYKKTVNILSNAARMSEAQYGINYASIDKQCSANGGNEKPDRFMTVCSILNGTLTGATYYANATDIKNYSITPGYFFNTDASLRALNTMQAYVLPDGTIVAISRRMGETAGKCTLSMGAELKDNTGGELQFCLGFIDVNGTKPPNKEVSCTSGSGSLSQNTCIVKNTARDLTDIYPIRFHDGIVEPASAAARYVLKNTK